jgi:hypothetical protein
MENSKIYQIKNNESFEHLGFQYFKTVYNTVIENLSCSDTYIESLLYSKYNFHFSIPMIKKLISLIRA